MSYHRRYRRSHSAKNLDVKEICDHLIYLETPLKTHDHVEIRKVLVANIPPEVEFKELKNTFSTYGEIVDCILKKKKSGGKSYAFVTYKSDLEVYYALRAGRERSIRILGQYLRVIPAMSWHQPDNIDNKSRNQSSNEFVDLEDLKEQLTSTTYYIIEDDSPIHTLNNDCLMLIFHHLPLIDRIKVEKVCKRWKIVSQESWCLQKKLDLNPTNWSSDGIYSRKFSDGPDACSLIKVIHRCNRYLTHIDLSKYSSKIGNSVLLEISKSCPNIQSINLEETSDFKPSGIRALASGIKNLRSFTYCGQSFPVKYKDEINYLLSKHRQLESVKIGDSILRHKVLMNLPVKNLQTLDLESLTVTEEFVKVLGQMKNLQILRLGYSNIFEYQVIEELIKKIGSLSELKELQLCSNHRTVNLEPGPVIILNPLTRLKNLKKLDLSRSHFLTDSFLIILTQNCREIISLSLDGCPSVTNEGILSISSLPNLEHLSIEGVDQVTDDAFESFYKLKTLKCRRCVNMRDSGLIKLIENCEKLELLDLNCCSLVTKEILSAAGEIAMSRKQKMTLCIFGTKVRNHEVLSQMNEYCQYLKCDFSIFKRLI